MLVLSVIETRPLLIRAIADAILDELHAVENAIAAASRVQ